MKKFSAVALAIFTLFAGVVMSACEEKIELSLSKQYLEMFIGDEVDIKPLVNLEGKAEVVISSLDNDIVVVKDGVATAQSAGVTIILAKAGNKTANMEVKVVGSAISADAPQGLRFDETQNAVVWDSQIINLDGVVETIKSYDVLISHNGQESTKTIVGDNKLELVESGEYIIKVKSNGRSDDEKIVYNSSQYSEALSLTKLPKPYDIEFADGVLKFKADELCKNFRVKVNGVLSDVITEKQMELSLSNIDPQTQQTFEISVVAVAEQNADKTYVSSESDSITRTRLFAPEMSINAGVITWDNSQQGDFHYEISRQAEGGISYSEVVSGGEYTLEGLPAGEYNTITLKAIADSEEYLDSENISSLEKITKLEKTTLAFDLETKTISASNFEGKKIELQIKHKNQTEKVDLTNGQYLWQKADAGLYEIVAYVYAQTAKEINSDVSNKIQITQLAKLSGSEFSQRLDENNNYILEFEDIAGANTYDFRVVKADGVNAGVSAGLIDQGDKNFGNADTIFSEAGAYKVYVTASYAGKLENNQFVLPSVSDLDVFRHSDMTIGQQADANGKVVAINWDSVSNVSGYMYVIEKDGQEFDDGTITGNSFSTTNFSFGRYTFKLKAIGLSGTQVLYLDSLTFAETSFEVEYELEKPTIVYDRELNAVIITKVEYATSYEIKMNNTDIPHDNSQENITISMEDKLNEAGIYTITVTAQNADNELILDSDISQINIKKHDAPKAFMLLADGTLTIQDYPNTIGLDADKETILINNVETAKLDDEEYFEVKAKFNAKQINVGNTYYIDSDYSTFVIERVDSSQKPALVGENITWTEFTQTGFSYVLHIEQEGLKTKIELTTASISVYDNRLAGINLNKDFSVAVEYKFSGAQINLPLQQSQKFSSKISEATTIQKIVNDVNMVATEANGEVTISWNACAIEDVVYNLYIGEEKAYTGNATSFVATQYFANEGVYSAKIEISKQGYITSDKNEITIERLKAVTNLNISAEENVEAVTNYNVSYTLEGSNGNYNLSKDVQVEKVLIKKGNEEITSLAQFDGIFTIDVSLVAKQNTSGTKFYLSSKTSSFEFNRAKTLNEPTVANSQILWETLEGIASYRLKFEADATSKSLDVTGQSISCDDTAIQNIISSFESREFEVSVMAVISAFVANSGESHLLSSRFSNAAELIKLNDVENITVVSTNDNFQKNITISWQHTQDASLVGGYVVEVMKGTTSIGVQTVGPDATSLTIEDGFKDAGEYSVNIVVIGQNNAINSDKITSDTYTRLFAPKNISITNEALITWTGVVGATKYVVDVYYNDTIKQTYQDITNTQLDISELMFTNNFAGDVNIKVLAVGGNGQDEAKTFSSNYSDVVVANKKATAILEFATNSVKITGDFENTSSLSFKLVVSADNRVVKTVDLKYGQTYVFENWTYADDGTKVPTNVQKVYTFAIQTFSTEANSLKSDIETQNVTKLKDVQNLGFVRDGEIDSNLYFVGDAVDNAHSYVLSVGAYKTSAFNLYNSQISLIVANDFEKALAQQFEITIYAQGEIGGNINYINSSTTTIKGQKLPTVTGFGVANGQLVWNKTEGATDYNLRISETNVKSGYVTDNNHTLFDTLFGLVGTQNVNIRAIGNVGTTPRSEDVILDSSYIRNAQSFELENLEVYKLAKVDSVEVVDGYITISFVDEAESYDIVVGENAYELKLFESVSETTNKMTSSALYSALTVNVGYQGQIVAKSTQSNVIYSDKTDAINIKILDNVTKNTLTIGFKPKGDGSYDYSIATASWFGDDTVALNGYKIDFSGDVLTVADTSYVLDPLGELVGGGVYTISVCVAGGSGVQTDGYCHLNSNYGEKVSFTKLESPTPYLENGLLSWTAVNGANGYLVYLDGLQQNPSIVNTTNFVLDKANLSGNIYYDEYKVIAISTATNAIASSAGIYLGIEEESGETMPIPVVKMKAPDMFTINNGEFIWEISFAQLLGFATSGMVEKPLTATLTSVENTKINIRFTNTQTKAQIVVSPSSAGDFIYCSDSTKQSIINFVPDFADYLIGLIDRPSWPSKDYHYLELDQGLIAGEYQINLQQIGDSLQLITSNYGDGKYVYIPHAPNLRVDYSETDGFVANWNAITIPENYKTGNVSYVVIGERMLEDGSIERIALADGITQTSLNLTELVNNETLDSSFVNLFVYVKGDNTACLNGKVSNQVKLNVLDKIEAYVKNGVLVWNEQHSAKGYQLYYYPVEDTANTSSVVLSDATWDSAPLLSSVEYYHVFIKALGIPQGSTTEVTITGKYTDVGKLTKLATPQVNVNEGVFEWQNIINSTSYSIDVSDGYGIIDTVSVFVRDGIVSYESTFEQENLEYLFKAIGSIDVQLTTGVLAYVNSNIDNGTYGTVLPKVTDVKATDGMITWNCVENNGEVLSYKLTFIRIDEAGNELNNEIVIKGNTFKVAGKDYDCAYDCSDLVESGKYKVYIQAYYQNSDTRGKYTHNGETAYYLMGVDSDEYQFYKYGIVDGIKIEDGEITWNYVPEDACIGTYRYKLTFTAYTGLTYEDFVYYAETESFSSYIIEELDFKNPFSLTIQVVPKQGQNNFVNSDIVTYTALVEGVETIVEIYQTKAISINEIVVLKPEGEQDLFISWEDYDPEVLALDVEYVVSYYTSEDAEVKYIRGITEKRINTTRLVSQIVGEHTLYYQIQVIPQGVKNFVPSYLHEVREIQKPKALTSIYFDELAQIFYWDTVLGANGQPSNAHSYKINDMVVQVDDNGTPVRDENGDYIPVRTYMFITSSSTDNTYAPIEQGYHVVSVAVVVKNAENEGSLTSSYTFYTGAGSVEEIQKGAYVNINLFAEDSGLGTQNAPYIIESLEQFENIKYRANKNAYQNTYVVRVGETDTTIALAEKDYQYTFKQMKNIFGAKPFTTEEMSEFFGTYDGNYYTIEWSGSLNGTSTLGHNVALFNTLAKSAVVKNLQVYFTLTGKSTAPTNVGGVAIINNGTISNVRTGQLGSTLNILESTKGLSLAMIAYQNYGRIEKAVNYYEVMLSHSSSTSGLSMGFAGIAYENYGTVSYCANYANFNLTSGRITAGGIVALNTSKGVVYGSTFKASNFAIGVVSQSASSVSAKVGGIVGNNQNGEISHSYVITSMAVTLSTSATSRTINIGGLVGATQGTNINYSYVDVTTTTVVTGVYQMVGSITSPNSNGSTCYYRNSSFTSGASGTFAPNAYTSYGEVKLNGAAVEFSETTDTAPTLNWEANFVTDWETHLEEQE